RHVPRLHRPEGRAIARPTARVSLLHLLVTLAVAAVLWGAAALFQTAYAGRIYPHVTIDHVAVRGMTRAEALAALGNTAAARLREPIPGRRLDPAGATAALSVAVDTHAAAAVTLPLQPVESALGHAQAEAARARARALLAAPIQFLWTAQSNQLWLLSRG